MIAVARIFPSLRPAEIWAMGFEEAMDMAHAVQAGRRRGADSGHADDRTKRLFKGGLKDMFVGIDVDAAIARAKAAGEWKGD